MVTQNTSALNMAVCTLLGGNRNCVCREILPNIQVGSEDFSCPNGTKQNPTGPSQDRPLPHILCFSSSLKGNSI